MYLCVCKGITELDVKRAGHAGIATSEALIATFGLHDDECCGRCALCIDEFVEVAADRRAREPATATA